MKIINIIDTIYQAIARFLLGILGGVIYWASPGIFIATILFVLAALFGSPEPSFIELLILWTILPMAIGAIFGQYYKMGGGLLSGIIVGSMSGWLMSGLSGESIFGENILAGLCGASFLAIIFGVLIGCLGGALGGGIAAIARQNPISPHQTGESFPNITNNMGIINIFAIPGFIIFGLLFPALVYSIYILVIGGDINKLEMTETFGICAFSLASPLVSIGAIKVLNIATHKYFGTNKQLLNVPIIETTTRELWSKFIPLLIGLITETIVSSLTALIFKKPVFGIGLIGAVASEAIQGIWEERGERHRSQAVFQIMISVFAVFFLEFIKLRFDL